MLQLPYRSTIQKNVFTLFFLVFSTCLFAQKNYSATDKSNILKYRKQFSVAVEEWNRKKLYQLGVFFEGIYDKYKDSSMNAAIRCYTIAASSESEYGNLKECYAAAAKLGKIYETGKSVPIQLQRAMIYYYLSDSKLNSNYNNLGNPVHNTGFQRIKQNYCSRDIVSVFRMRSMIDSLVIEFSPFCNLQGNRLDLALTELSAQLNQNPEKKIEVTITGGPSIPAAQYTLKVENFILPAIYNKCVSLMVGNGFSSDRVLPMKRDLFDSNEYKMVLRVIQ